MKVEDKFVKNNKKNPNVIEESTRVEENIEAQNKRCYSSWENPDNESYGKQDLNKRMQGPGKERT